MGIGVIADVAEVFGGVNSTQIPTLGVGIVGGGEVLEADGKIIGALGVSGGSAKEDTELAAYGKEAFKEVLACL